MRAFYRCNLESKSTCRQNMLSVSRGLEQETALPRDSFLQPYYNDVYEYLRVGPPLLLVVKNLNMSRGSSNIDVVCSISGCNDSSLLNQVEPNHRVAYMERETRHSFIKMHLGMTWGFLCNVRPAQMLQRVKDMRRCRLTDHVSPCARRWRQQRARRSRATSRRRWPPGWTTSCHGSRRRSRAAAAPSRTAPTAHRQTSRPAPSMPPCAPSARPASAPPGPPAQTSSRGAAPPSNRWGTQYHLTSPLSASAFPCSVLTIPPHRKFWGNAHFS